MLLVKLKSWTAQANSRLVGFFANSFLSRFSFFFKHHSGLKLECQANFKFQSWMMLEARPCLLFRGHETNQYLVQKFIYSSARDWSSKICAKDLYYIYFIWSKIAWGWVLGWEGFFNMTEILKHKPPLTLLRAIT